MRNILLLVAFLATLASISQNVKSPSEFLGYELGTRFSRHHQVTDYYKHVAAAMPNQVKLVPYGYTNEGRELMVVYVSSAQNMADLENIRQEHLKATKGEGNAQKAIVWLSYNVHGNESVSTEASMQTIYELLTQKQAWLENTVVIIDPCINPDGRDRYVNWYNQYVNSPYNVDPNSKEHHEGWLSGRANHYMFDLNRDWAWLTQVESRQRLKVFNRWLPHVHVDFHEQGVDEPYYFAPAAEPLHEVITPWQREFQVTIGKNHAKYFDANGWFYFTKEVFDLLYPSYGDTYPTYNGGIGMTYEQGGSGRAGLGIITSYGDTLTLKDRIAHHHTTGLSTVEISSLNAERLNAEYKKFYTNQNHKYKSFVLSGDADKISLLTNLLDAHQIEYGYGNGSAIKGYSYKTGKVASSKAGEDDLVVSVNQTKGALVKVLFEPNAKLSDSLTYDITAWSLPYAYGLDAVASETLVSAKAAAENSTLPNAINPNSYAWLANWSSMNDARFLADLLKNGIRVRHNLEPFSLNGKDYARGTLIITKADNRNVPNLTETLKKLATKHAQSLDNAMTGFVDKGKDFGSDSVKMIPNVNVAVLSGEPTSTLSFGEIWHFFEQQLGYPVTVLDTEYFSNVDLSKYHVLILPEFWGSLDDNQTKKVKDWVRNGGKLIAIGDALGSLTGDDGFGLARKEIKKDSVNTNVNTEAYAGVARDYIKNMITGAIFKAKVDVTNPLAFGYGDTYFTLKLSGDAFELLESGNAVYLEDNAKPFSGFAGSEAQKKQSNSLIFGAQREGRGHVVFMVDNPLFRGFWENGKLFFVNAVFAVGNR